MIRSLKVITCIVYIYAFNMHIVNVIHWSIMTDERLREELPWHADNKALWGLNSSFPTPKGRLTRR